MASVIPLNGSRTTQFHYFLSEQQKIKHYILSIIILNAEYSLKIYKFPF